MNDKKKVFISYAKEDIGIARRLYYDLKETGVIPWMDEEDLKVGQNLKFEKSQAIKGSSYFLTLLSSNSVSKEGYVRKELKMALDMLNELPKSKIFLLPIRLDNCHPLDEELQDLEWGDLFPSYESGLERILYALGLDNKPDAGAEFQNENLISRSIEFPPQYYQAGISILNYFGTVLRKKYPDTKAKIRIEQEDLKITMIIDPVEGEREIIEKALDEYGLVITGNMTPEEFTNDRLLLIEMKSELRYAQNKIELQQELLQDKGVQIDKLLAIVGNAVQRDRNINITLDRAEINADGDVSYAKDMGSTEVLKESVPETGETPIDPEKKPTEKLEVKRLRSEPKTLSDDDVKAMFAKHNFFAKNFNPSGIFRNDFKNNEDGTVTDNVTGLMWQQSGSDNYIYFENVQAYIDSLNHEQFAGYNNWRLPTLEELASLFENKQVNGRYIDPVFASKQRWCLSADKNVSGRAWDVYFNSGDVNWDYVDSGNYVRAVRLQTIKESVLETTESLIVIEKPEAKVSELVSKKLVKTPDYEKKLDENKRLRSEPKTLSDNYVKAMFVKHHFFDSNFNKSDEFKNDFKNNGDGTITDNVTGLMWQRSGSDKYIYFKNIKDYINRLNTEQFAGYSDWRLPTLEELASLLKNKQVNDLYIDHVFDSKQWWCWSVDKRVFGGGWYIHFNLGVVGWDVASLNYVRAVRFRTI
ncbi:MAG: DUF1566 domain-containing protein [Desulfobacteraceae bacterium]|nr:DUF1566 domain-containing protein [Desulfobacteraceae bacterium]